MACIDRTTWNAAVAACNAQSSVKGLGIWAGKRRPRGMNGLGILGDATAVDLSVAAPTSDPCAIAAQTPCPDSARPPSLISYCRQYPSAASCQPKPVVTHNLVPTPPPPAASTKTAGYMKMGILAALVVVGGVALYKSTHKKAS